MLETGDEDDVSADSEWEGFESEDEIEKGNQFSEAGVDPAARGNIAVENEALVGDEEQSGVEDPDQEEEIADKL
jgi:hypothetical protein